MQVRSIVVAALAAPLPVSTSQSGGFAAFLVTAAIMLSPVLRPPAQGQVRTGGDHAAQMARGTDIFKKHVRPILLGKCYRCHGGKTIESELDLTDRDGLVRGGSQGPAVVPGKRNESLLFKLITHSREPHMPQGGRRLGKDVIDRFGEWIDCGAPYDAPLVAREQLASWTKVIVPGSARQHWAFQRLKQVAPPDVKNTGWVRTPIDRFILRRLEEAGIQPGSIAPPRTLLRRLYFDMLGLPPAPEDVVRFLSDNSADSYARFVDKVQASPHHGERWARHWLDLVRFGESHGFEHDYDRPSAYPYRDFVIEAIQQDMPFDTFVKWQLAGDEFAPWDNRAMRATGFLAAGVHSTQITKREVEKHRYDEMDDMLSVTGASMLGLTIGCARCHDHKYDPIPQRDYYQLVSTFTSTVRNEVDLDVDPDWYRQAKARFDEAHAVHENRLREFETGELPARLASWESKLSLKTQSDGWIVLELEQPKSAGGARFVPQDDGSLRVEGPNAKFDTYTLSAQTQINGITAVRLEALSDPALVKGGPGRAANGNFALAEFRLKAARRVGQSAPAAVALRNPRATFEQKGLPIALTLDGNDKTGWAIDPEFGKNHAAVFEVMAPVGFPDGTALTFELAFTINTGHNIGRLRLSVRTTPVPPDLRGEGIPEKILTILRSPAKERSPGQSTALLQWYRTKDPEWRSRHKAVLDHLARAPKPRLVKTLVSSEGLPALRLHTQGEDFLPETHFLRRGDPDQKEGVAKQGFLQVLMPGPNAGGRWQVPAPKGWRTSYKRTALANWLTDVEDGAGALLARVIVNRLWQHHMGRGLVSTPSNFGLRGELPTHPELLEWLAGELVRSGWRLGPIHKLILTSAVYMQDSHADPARIRHDPENRLYSYRTVRRLEAEVIRDAMLAVSGSLDTSMFGPGTLDPNSKRRSIYFTVKRSKLVPMMQVFDAPDALGSVSERPISTVAPQALYLMNNPNVHECARSLANVCGQAHPSSLSQAVASAYLRVLARAPTAEELRAVTAFVHRQAESYTKTGKADSARLALADFCQALLCLNEFVYVE